MVTITYVVKSGDWLAKIAEDHGTTVSGIWSHPENAAHRQKRGSPDVLYPGDVLRIDIAEAAQPPALVPTEVTPNPPALPSSMLTAEWPYPPFEGPWSTAPTWECPGGTCACHPVPEDGPKEEHVIVFFTPQGVRMPGARCRVYEQGRLLTPEPSSADGAGELRVELRAGTATLRVEWAPPNMPAHEFLPYRKIYNVKMSDEAGDVGLDRRLANLGFARGRRRSDNVADYQRAYSRDPNGNADEIRLEVLERHDNGTVQVFHPQPSPGDTPVGGPSPQSFFGSPLPPQNQGGSRLGFAADGKGREKPMGSGGGSGKTSAGKNVKGSAVPDAGNLALAVAFEPDFPVLNPDSVKVKLRPVNVPGMTPEKRNQDVNPRGEPIPFAAGTRAPKEPDLSWPNHLVYLFADLPTGTYTATASMPLLNQSGTRETRVHGTTEVELKMGLLSTATVRMRQIFDAAICQDMKRDPATENPDLYYKLAHIWAEKWKEASPTEREFRAVTPAASTNNPMDEGGIKKLAARMLKEFTIVCEKARSATVYMALSHGGVELTDQQLKELPTRKEKLEKDREALKKKREEWREIKRTAHKDDIEAKEKSLKLEQAVLSAEAARINRSLFPTFSLGSQKGGLHKQFLAMDFEYFIYRDHPAEAFSDNEKKCFEARKEYFAKLKAIFTENKIKTLHLIACNIGQDSTFIERVAKELGVRIFAYELYTDIKIGTGFMGLSRDGKTDDVVPATSVEPPKSHSITVDP